MAKQLSNLALKLSINCERSNVRLLACDDDDLRAGSGGGCAELEAAALLASARARSRDCTLR